MMRKSRARELEVEKRALRRQMRHANRSVIRGIPGPMLMEIAYDLTALGFHDLSRLCRAAAEGIAIGRASGDPKNVSQAS